jgi:hypothetical protein
VTLSEKQRKFTLMVSKLIQWAYDHGYELTFGEALRTQEMAEIYAKRGVGIKGSCHLLRLAVDLNLFIAGQYKTETKAYEPLGLFWESIGGSWGGRFNDGNHFSLEHEGVR